MNKPSNNIYLKRRPFYNFNSLSFTAIFFLQFLQDCTNNRNNVPIPCSPWHAPIETKNHRDQAHLWLCYSFLYYRVDIKN